MSSAALSDACNAGVVMALGDIDLELAPGGKEVFDDFIGDGLSRCGVGSFIWSTLFVVDPHSFDGAVPSTLADVFNPRRFAGTRVLMKSRSPLFEMALMADGVKSDQVYSSLATPAGVKRALRKVDVLRGHAMWVSKQSDALDYLTSGQTAIAMVHNGRAFRHAISRGYRLIWDGSVHDMTYWAVPRATRNGAVAKSFIKFATSPNRLADQARLWPYGPARRSAVSLVGKHPYLAIDLEPFLPTAPQNLAKGINSQAAFWREHGERLQVAFHAWLSDKRSTKKKVHAGSKKRKKMRRKRR